MLDFIVIGLPRSATTWTANWLTTDQSICLHDATGRFLPHELDAMPGMAVRPKYLGISCTGAWLWKEWIESHRAPVLILERDIEEVNSSLVEIGLPPMTRNSVEFFKSVKGFRVPYNSVFDNPKEVWAYLLPHVPFDEERHAELLKINMQPMSHVQVPDEGHVKKVMASVGTRVAEISR